MPEQDLDGPDVGSGFEQVGRETMAQSMDRNAFTQARGFAHGFARHMHWFGRHRTIRVLARKEPGTGTKLRSSPTGLPILSKEIQQPRGEHDVAVLASLGLTDADDHALAVDVLDAQCNHLRDPQAGSVGRHQNGAVLEVGDGLKELADFRRTQDDGQLLFLLRADDALDDPVLAEGDVVEEPQSAEGLVVVAPRDVPLMDEMDQVRADIGRPQLLGRLAEVLCKLSDTLDVNLDCPGARLRRFMSSIIRCRRGVMVSS